MSKRVKNHSYIDESIQFALEAEQSGWVSLEQIMLSQTTRRANAPSIGRLALYSHRITVSQAARILDVQAFSDLSFGQIAIDLGIMTKPILDNLRNVRTALMPTLSEVMISDGSLSPEQAVELNHRLRERLGIQPRIESPIAGRPHMNLNGNQQVIEHVEHAL